MIPTPVRLTTLAAALLLAAAGLSPRAQEEAPPRLRWAGADAEPSRATVELRLPPRVLELVASTRATPAAIARWFAVRVDDGDDAGETRPALLGDYRVVEGALRFTPRFPLSAGLAYRAEFNPARLRDWLTAESATTPALGPDLAAVSARFAVPEGELSPAARVTRISPEGPTLPENLLRFYIHFSAPMSRGEAYRHLRLLDDRGEPVAAPFLELGEELWSPDGTRFTLLLDPGRIKRGLRPREELGPILVEGKDYTLIVDRRWPDARGRPLAADGRKAFHAGPADETPPDPAAWTLDIPEAGTTGRLLVHFPEPLDRALLERVVGVTDPDGRPLAGRVEVDADGKGWRFTPERPWQRAEHLLTTATTLEDLAGNSVGRPFEVDEFEPIRERVREETVSRPFAPR